MPLPFRPMLVGADECVAANLSSLLTLATYVRLCEESINLGSIVVEEPRASDSRIMMNDYGSTPSSIVRSGWIASLLGRELCVEIVDSMPHRYAFHTTCILSGSGWSLTFAYCPAGFERDGNLFGQMVNLLYPVLIGDSDAFETDQALMKFVVQDLDATSNKFYQNSFNITKDAEYSIPCVPTQITYNEAVRWGYSDRQTRIYLE